MLNFSELNQLLENAALMHQIKIVNFSVYSFRNKVNLNVVIEKMHYVAATLNDCQIINKIAKLWLKNENATNNVYLIVKTTNVDRELFSIDDCQHFVGHSAKFKLKKSGESDAKTIQGMIKSANHEIIIMYNNVDVVFAWQDVEKAAIIYNWESKRKKEQGS
jgi:ribosome maturation factor RimP